MQKHIFLTFIFLGSALTGGCAHKDNAGPIESEISYLRRAVAGADADLRGLCTEFPDALVCSSEKASAATEDRKQSEMDPEEETLTLRKRLDRALRSLADISKNIDKNLSKVAEKSRAACDRKTADLHLRLVEAKASCQASSAAEKKDSLQDMVREEIQDKSSKKSAPADGSDEGAE